ncbi:nuclear transport factor 2 family protein [Christiangramia sp.]|uniref:YybH family protein n=1 Tax=Christiangramia sp. TaxID=1931228 RepID=UPI002623E434|nr:nuclear transport factor 2 family protein [Christiangramia sp.]
MKTRLVLTVILSSFFFFYGCSDNEDNLIESELVSQGSSSLTTSSASKSSSVTSQTFPQAQQEVLETWEAIVQSVKEGDLDELISFHAYSPKFTEFKNGELRNGSEANEEFERGVFGSVTEVVKLEAQDMEIAVYFGNVANMTFHSNFHLKFGEDLVVIREQTSLLFVKTKGEWKIVHEHHSPLNAG